MRSVSGSKALKDELGVAIIISASGICEAGRILHHLKNNIGKSKTTVLFVGYCADNALGRPIRDHEREVSILGERHMVRAKVKTVDSFSGHAEHSELLDYFQRITGPKKRVWLVHGESQSAAALQDGLALVHQGPIEIAELGKVVEF